MAKIFCTTGLKGKDIEVSDDIVSTVVEQKSKIPLIIDEGEGEGKLRGTVGIIEPAGPKSARINIPPYIFDEIYDNIENYNIKKITNVAKQVLFLLSKK